MVSSNSNHLGNVTQLVDWRVYGAGWSHPSQATDTTPPLSDASHEPQPPASAELVLFDPLDPAKPDTATAWHTVRFAARYEYDPFGNVVNDLSAYAYAEENPWRFSTKQFNDATGLGYWGYRYYSPTLGRWISRDPIGERGGVNLYGYVGHASTRKADAFGLEETACCLFRDRLGEVTIGEPEMRNDNFRYDRTEREVSCSNGESLECCCNCNRERGDGELEHAAWGKCCTCVVRVEKIDTPLIYLWIDFSHERFVLECENGVGHVAQARGTACLRQPIMHEEAVPPSIGYKTILSRKIPCSCASVMLERLKLDTHTLYFPGLKDCRNVARRWFWRFASNCSSTQIE